MLKRAKAKQHLRHTKSGKTVTVNRGVNKKLNPNAGKELEKVLENIKKPNFLTQGKEFDLRKKDMRIPPAWEDVKINADSNADLLATGIDAKGRKQYIYSQNSSAKNSALKFVKIEKVMKVMDNILQKNSKNLNSRDPKTKELSTIMALVHNTGLRPGSTKDTKANVQAYGATTLEGRHVVQTKEGVMLKFTAKKGVNVEIPVTDKKIVADLMKRKKSSGPKNRLYNVEDNDLRNYSKGLGEVNPKDFRTVKGTTTAMQAAAKMKPAKTEAEYKRMVKEIATQVSKVLGNTPAIALKSYINPIVFNALKPK